MYLELNRTDPAIDFIYQLSVAIQQAGGHAFLVGGLVRDQVMGQLNLIPMAKLPPARDFDLEVYQLDGALLRNVLTRFGRVNAVGEAFTVYKISRGHGESRIEVDVSLPRRESKTGKGHKGFTVTGDPSMSITEAARRRDFTINALMCDLLTGEISDPFHGIEDIKARLLQVVDPTTFVEDSLRVLRGMQFAARFQFTIAQATRELCQTIPLDDLPCERIWGEIEKLLLRASQPSLGLQAGLEMGVIERLFPQLQALVGCPQEYEWHPEGDVWVHTLQVIDQAAQLISDLPKAQQLTVMLASLCHDLGKPPTTSIVKGRIRSLEHEPAGIKPTEQLLDLLNIHTLEGYNIREQVIALVANHLKPGQFYKQRDIIHAGAFRRLARKCELELLYRVAKADSLGRYAPDAPLPNADAQEWFHTEVLNLGVAHEAPQPLLMGRHLLEMGLLPGPQLGKLTAAVYELQLDGQVTNLAEALEAARKLIKKN